MYLTTPGLVLRVSPYNDTDAMLTVLTGEHGKISAKVRGLRRKNSPLSAPCQLLSYAEFTFFEYKGNFTVNEAHTLELFAELRRDLQKLSLGTYFAQAAELISQEDVPNPELISLTLNCLYALSKLGVTENKAKAVFELRCACLAGYTPDLGECYRCGGNPSFFDTREGRMECVSCHIHHSEGIRIPVSDGVLAAMRYICTCPPKTLFSFSLSSDGEKRLSEVTEAFLCAQLERGFSALDFYKTLLIQI